MQGKRHIPKRITMNLSALIAGCFIWCSAELQAATLIGHWSFDEGSGSTAYDSSGNSADGAIVGAVWTADSWSGTALYFDGVDDSVLMPDGAWNKAAPLTISYWYKRETTVTNNRFPIDHRCKSQPGIGGWGAFQGFQVIDSNGTVQTSYSEMTVNEWMHKAVVISPTEMKVYVNGELKSTTAIAGLPKLSGYLSVGAACHGSGIESNPLFRWKGWVDEVRIYDDVLTPDEVRALGGVRIPSLAWTERSNWINVKTDVIPAAVGDGVTDDTAAIQAAMNVVVKGETIYFPPGIYKITDTLIFTCGTTAKWCINMVGHGRDTILRWHGLAGEDMIEVNGNPYCKYEGLTFDGQGNADSAFYHYNTTKFESNVRYRNMAFYNFTGAAIHPETQSVDAYALDSPSFENCIFDNCGIGIWVRNRNDYNFTIAGCDFISCGQGIRCEGGTFYARDCYFNGSTLYDIFGSLPEHGCSVRRCKSTGSDTFLQWGTKVSALVVEDCYVTDWQTAPAVSISQSAMTFSHNRFVNPPTTDAPIYSSVPTRLTTHKLIMAGNEAPQSSALVSGLNFMEYNLPAGSVSASVGNAKGADITTFVRQEVEVPAVVYDAIIDFGAVGDEVVDDTAAVQACINAAAAAGNGAIAYFPIGQYKVTSTLTVSGSDFVIGGSGFKSRLIWGGASGGTLMRLTDPDNVTVENMCIGYNENAAPLMTNDIDIEQVSNGSSSLVRYNGIYVHGKYRQEPEVKGLLLNGLDADDIVVMDFVVGNIRLLDSANATVVGNITYEGSITVDHDSATRNGFLGFMSRFSTGTLYGVAVHENNSIVLSDFYYEQSNNDGIILDGRAEDPSGRATIHMPKAHNWLPVNTVKIDDYSGQITVIAKYTPDALNPQFSHTGTRSVGITLYSSTFYGCVLTYSGGTGANYSFVGNFANGTSGVAPADSYNAQTLTDLSMSMDDLLDLGWLDLELNYPWVADIVD